MKTHHPLARRARAQGAYVFIVLFMGILAAAFFRVQVLRSDTWELRAESNRLRQLPVPAPRGTIYDRNGRILADNVPGYAITLLPGPPDSIRSTLERMQPYMEELTDERVERLLTDLRRYGTEVVVDADAPFGLVSALEERRSEFPDVYIEMRPRRRYPSGEVLGHVMGYVGEITREELGSESFPEGFYDQGMVVGKTGIERQYETMLQGRRGLRYVEVDARGRIVGDFSGFTADRGDGGDDLQLNLDLDLQEWVHEIWPDSMTGALVALDPADGGVLALYSAPSFDPNEFVGGIDSELWAELNTAEEKPLYNRATLGLYAPASTFKLASAGLALDAGAITPEERMPVPCTGSFYYGNRSWGCWYDAGHGYNNLSQAIANSCDVYFYQMGLKVGLEDFLTRATDVGFSRECGIDLPQESRGIFPADKSFWNERFGYTPQEGEVLSLAIGQGPNSQTPLKMAQFYTALARDGSAPPPTLARGIELGEGWSLNLEEEDLASLREGMRAVTAPGGTAHFRTAMEHWEVIGKTGTGEHALSQAGIRPEHAWFAGLAGPPGEAPEIVIVALVEYGASGSQTASPIVAKAADFYLRRKYGIPIDTIQTYMEHLQSGTPAPWYRERFLR